MNKLNGRLPLAPLSSNHPRRPQITGQTIAHEDLPLKNIPIRHIGRPCRAVHIQGPTMQLMHIHSSGTWDHAPEIRGMKRKSKHNGNSAPMAKRKCNTPTTESESEEDGEEEVESEDVSESEEEEEEGKEDVSESEEEEDISESEEEEEGKEEDMSESAESQEDVSESGDEEVESESQKEEEEGNEEVESEEDVSESGEEEVESEEDVSESGEEEVESESEEEVESEEDVSESEEEMEEKGIEEVESEELKSGDKWTTLKHNGPYFAPPYQQLREGVHLLYNENPMRLCKKAEEAAGFYAKTLSWNCNHDLFRKNFFEDWKNMMTEEEKSVIKSMDKCDFTLIHQHYARKKMSSGEKLKLKEEILEQYGWCWIDGQKQRIGNYKIEPPGLFRGRGDHPKQGRIKKRIEPKDVVINIGRNAKVPSLPQGQEWKEVKHDTKVTWLASWTDIQGSTKYVLLSPSSRIKGASDLKKYNTARELKSHVDEIREQYKKDWKSTNVRVMQRGVALYFIDELAIRVGNEKDTDECADTVGCCSLRVEHLELHEEKDEKENVIEFDFLGKDSIPYDKCISVERQVFENVQLFMSDKNEGDKVFNLLTTSMLNSHLAKQMTNLTAKVFRTYNASKTFQEQLDKLTVAEDSETSKRVSYYRANKEVGILCNHRRAAPKKFDKSKIIEKQNAITEASEEIESLKKVATSAKKLKIKQRSLKRLKGQLHKLEQENREIALGTSKLHYLDPRISVAWCKKWNIPIEKIYTKTQQQKFAWAIDMADKDFEF